MITINTDPVWFSIGPLEVRWYGLMIAIAVLQLIFWLAWQSRKGAKITYDNAITAGLIGIPSGLIGSRLLHVIDNWSFYSQNPGQIIGAGGLTIWGAILGATVGLWVYSRFAKFQFGYVADLLAPAIILGQAIGRIGCTIQGCCPGTPASVPWAVVYTNPNTLGPSVPTHPVVVYEMIFDLIAFGVLLKLRNRFKPDGILFAVYLSLYSAWRLGIGFLRENTTYVFGLNEAQIVSFIVLAITLPIIITKMRLVKPVPQEDVSQSS